jgi:hypothetical protein
MMPARSAERARLSEAIARLSGLDRQLERLNEARSRLDQRGKEAALYAARRGFDEARKNAPATIVARALNEPYDLHATVDRAQELLEASQRDLDEARTADRLLADEIKIVEERREVAQHARDHAVAEVVKSSAEVAELCAKIEQTRQQLNDFNWVLSAIGLLRLPQGFTGTGF